MTVSTHSLPKPSGRWKALRFIFISGRLGLDFAHTGGEGDRARFERLHAPADLAEWLSQTLAPIDAGRITPSEFKTALALREAIWQAAQAICQAQLPQAKDIALINQAAAQAELIPQLEPDGENQAWQVPCPLSAALSTIARDVIDLFSSPLRRRIRICANPRCQLMFVDTSRPGRRRWCAMQRCGNLTKTARYRRRQTRRRAAKRRTEA